MTLTAITPDGPTTTATFAAGDTEKTRATGSRAQAAGRNVYFQVNETPARCATKPKKKLMIAALCRHADIGHDDRSIRISKNVNGCTNWPMASTLIPSCHRLRSLIRNGMYNPCREQSLAASLPEIIDRVEAENRDY